MNLTYDYVQQRMADQQDSAQRRRLVTHTRRRPTGAGLVPFVRRRAPRDLEGCRD